MEGSVPRLFIAIDTPESVRPDLFRTRDLLKSLDTDVKWESDNKLHCTLKFLGDTESQGMPSIVSMLADIGRAFAPLMVTYTGLGCFPNRLDPRIIWAGIHDPENRLAGLARSIDRAMSTCGFEQERRPFSPHVTIGRVKGRRGLGELLATMESITFDCPPVLIQEILLVRSDLRPSGSLYSVLERVALQGTQP